MSDDSPYYVPKLVRQFNRMGVQKEKVEITNLDDDRQDLLNRLRLSRDELDAYIRHTKRVLLEKKRLEQENNELQARLDASTLKNQRLEKQEETLIKGCYELLKTLQETHDVYENPASTQIAKNMALNNLKQITNELVNHKILHSSFQSKSIKDLETIQAELASAYAEIRSLTAEVQSLRLQCSSSHSTPYDSCTDSPFISVGTTPEHHQPDHHDSAKVSKGNSQQKASSSSSYHDAASSGQMIAKQINTYLDKLSHDINQKLSILNTELSHSGEEFTRDACLPICLPVSTVSNHTNVEDSNSSSNDATNTNLLLLNDRTKVFEESLESTIEQLSILITSLSVKVTNLKTEIREKDDAIARLQGTLEYRDELRRFREQIHREKLSQAAVSCKCKEEVESLTLTVERLNQQLESKERELQTQIFYRSVLLSAMEKMGLSYSSLTSEDRKDNSLATAHHESTAEEQPPSAQL